MKLLFISDIALAVFVHYSNKELALLLVNLSRIILGVSSFVVFVEETIQTHFIYHKEALIFICGPVRSLLWSRVLGERFEYSICLEVI